MGMERGGDKCWGLPSNQGVFCSWAGWDDADRGGEPEQAAKCRPVGSGGGAGGTASESQGLLDAALAQEQ